MSRHFHRVTGLYGWGAIIACLVVAISVGAAVSPAFAQRDGRQGRPERVRPGITVLFDERIGLVQGRRVALITNQTGVNEKGESDIELLTSAKAKKARIELVALFSPEHGIRGTEDRTNLSDERDARSGLMIHSLYAAGACNKMGPLCVNCHGIGHPAVKGLIKNRVDGASHAKIVCCFKTFSYVAAVTLTLSPP